MDSIIFDLDGTLWDSTIKAAEAWNDAIREHNMTKPYITAPLLQSLFGQTLPDIAVALFPTLSVEERLKLIDRCCKRHYELLLCDSDAPYPNAETTLQYLASKYSLFVVSNCLAGYIEIFLKVTNLGKYFKDHLCPGDTGEAKAYNISKIISRNQLSSAIYVGDTNGDYKAATAAGIPFVHAAYGFGQPEGFDYSINDLSDLAKLF